MKLELNNFGRFEHYTLTLPDAGRILIQGPSGSGKSTIVRAIIFALFGTGKKLVKYGKRSCEVILEINNLHISRKKGPEKLVVTIGDDTYEDDVAQAILHQHYPSPTIFYQDQHQEYNILRKTPQKQLEIMQTLTGFNSAYASYIKEHQKKLKTGVTECEYKVSSLNTILMESPPTESEDELMRLQCQLLQQSEQIRSDIEKSEKYRDLITQKNILQSQIDAIEVKDDQLISQELQQVMKKLNYHDLLHDYENYTKCATLKQDLGQLPSTDTEVLSQQQSEYDKLQSLQRKLQKLQPITSEQVIIDLQSQLNSLKLSMNRYECPSCMEMVYLDKDHLLKCSDQESAQTVSVKIKGMSSELETILQNNRKYTRIVDKMEGLHSVDVSKELCESRRIYKKRVELKQQLSAIPKVSWERIKDFVILQGIEDQQSLYNQKGTLEVSLELTRHNQQDRNNLQSKLKQLLHDSTSLNIPDTIPTNDEYTDTLNQLHTVRDKIRRLPLREHFSNLQRIKDELKHHQSELETASVLLGMIQDAERYALNNFVEQINSELPTYLSEFYDDPPICTIHTAKKITFNISHGGYDVNLTNLSGGEQDRLMLALTCVLCEITQTPFMILDESISSLDMDTSSSVFDAMSNLKENKLIIYIAHQMVEGHYDEVIRLDEN